MPAGLPAALFQLNNAPKMFGAFHIAAAVTCIFLSAAAARLLRQYDRERIIRAGGYLFLISEIFRQLYLYLIINGRQFAWWYFPFQLCSTPLYLTLLFPYLKKEVQDGACTYLSTFSLIAALCAFAYPQDMLKEYIPYSVNSFFWHGLMLFFSFFLILKQEVRPHTFRSALGIFSLFAGIALLINVAVHALEGGTSLIDMFYINPYTSTGQPFFSVIESLFGRPAEIIVYLASLAGAARILYRLILQTEK